jgi:hypothetical protein
MDDSTILQLSRETRPTANTLSNVKAILLGFFKMHKAIFLNEEMHRKRNKISCYLFLHHIDFLFLRLISLLRTKVWLYV